MVYSRLFKFTSPHLWLLVDGCVTLTKPPVKLFFKTNQTRAVKMTQKFDFRVGEKILDTLVG